MIIKYRWLIASFLFLLPIVFTLHKNNPVARVKGPTVHYHGYDLNKVAIHRAKIFTVLISAEGFGPKSRGTGIVIDEQHVLTCQHVAQHENEELMVYLYPGHIVAKGKMVYNDSAKDLAILELDVKLRGGRLPVFQANHFDGEPITIIGNALGSMKWFVAYGIISGENERDLYTDGLVLGGDSGGPWINEKGEVVALSDWGLAGRDNKNIGISGGISAKVIQQFLADWKHPSILRLLFGN